MGLRSVIQRAVQTAFVAVGDIPVSVDYKEFDRTTLNTSTGSEAYYFVYEGISGILANYKADEIDGQNILLRDQKLLLAGLDITFTPKSDDRVVITNEEDPEIWEVLDVNTDPVKGLYTCHIRRIQ